MRTAILTTAAALLLTAWVQPQVQGKFEGIVVDPEGNPLEGVSIAIVSIQFPSRKFNIKSDASGKFLQIGIWPGQYQATFKKKGYTSVSTDVRVKISESTRLKITLRVADEMQQKQLSQADSWFIKGSRLYEQEKYEEAAKAYEQAIQLQQDQWAYYFNLGLSYKKAGQLPSAVRAFQKAVELNPESYSCNKEMAEALATDKNFTAAKGYYAKAMEINPDDPDTNYNYGIVLIDLGESEDALNAMLRAVDLKPDYADAYYHIGTIYIGRNEKEKAISALEKFLELAPEHPQAPVAKQLLEYLRK